jgi:thiamine transport system ATP-binding protein
VALARALAPEPRLLMLDEPLGSLDRALRERLVDELRAVLGAARLPAIYVTHDHEEAFALAARVLVMRAGRIVQAGTADELWRRPADAWVAAFLGFGEAARGVVDGSRVVTPWGTLPVAEGTRPGPCDVVIRPGARRLSLDGPIHGVVAARRFAGEHVVLEVAVASAPRLEVRVEPAAAPPLGARAALSVDPAGVLVYPPTRAAGIGS